MRQAWIELGHRTLLWRTVLLVALRAARSDVPKVHSLHTKELKYVKGNTSLTSHSRHFVTKLFLPFSEMFVEIRKVHATSTRMLGQWRHDGPAWRCIH
jgi:hypothetical protein